MGYEFHLSRKYYWCDPDDQSRIERSEWLDYVNRDDEVIADPKNDKNSFVMLLGNEECPLWYHADLGELYSKNPSTKAIAKMFRIANSLGAEVLGDDDESYGPDGKMLMSSNERYYSREREK